MQPRFHPGRVRALAFDLDGTLLDTLPDLADAAQAMLAALGRPPAAETTVRSFVGDGVARLVERLLAGSRDGLADPGEAARGVAAFGAHYAANLCRRSRPFPGVMEGVRRLSAAGFALACVTNKPERFARPLLEAFGLDRHMPLVVGGDTLAARKPDPEPLLHAQRRLGLPATALLMVGDSVVDVRCARAAGCPVVCVPYGYSPAAEVAGLGADAIVESIDQLASVLLEHSSAIPP